MRRHAITAAIAGLCLMAAANPAYAAPTPATTPAPAPTTPRIQLRVAPIAEGQYVRGAGWGAVGGWSRYHTGLDFAASIGTPVLAVRDGVVIESKAAGWAGISVMIDHGAEGTTLYTYLNDATVQPGQRVRRGEVIGHVGVTGRTFGPHLHLEWYPAGADLANPHQSKDPVPFLQRQAAAAPTAKPSTPAATDRPTGKDARGGLAKTGH